MAIHLFPIDDPFLISAVDDEEDSPWLVATDFHYQAVKALEDALRRCLARYGPHWYVSAETFVGYPLATPRRRGQVAPDVYAAPVAAYLRNTFEVAREGIVPPFVVEIVSDSSVERDTAPSEKVGIYDHLGVQEYVLFDAIADHRPHLWGYRRNERGQFVEWMPESDGSLRSALLGARLRMDGHRVRVLAPDGAAMPFPEELDAALLQAETSLLQTEAALLQTEAALLQAEAARDQEAAARRALEDEVATLRSALARGI